MHMAWCAVDWCLAQFLYSLTTMPLPSNLFGSIMVLEKPSYLEGCVTPIADSLKRANGETDRKSTPY